MLWKALEAFPPTIDETHNRIPCVISDQDSQHAIRILRWLAFSYRPLSVEEISEMVATDIRRHPAFGSQKILEDPMKVLTICSSLVTITTSGELLQAAPQDHAKLVTFAYYSVKEYLILERSRHS
jgi:hypothetical protein